MSKGDSFLEVFYSMSNSKGYYFTSDSTDCHGDGCDWDIDHEQILCDYFGIEELKEMNWNWNGRKDNRRFYDHLWK